MRSLLLVNYVLTLLKEPLTYFALDFLILKLFYFVLALSSDHFYDFYLLAAFISFSLLSFLKRNSESDYWSFTRVSPSCWVKNGPEMSSESGYITGF